MTVRAGTPTRSTVAPISETNALRQLNLSPAIQSMPPHPRARCAEFDSPTAADTTAGPARWHCLLGNRCQLVAALFAIVTVSLLASFGRAQWKTSSAQLHAGPRDGERDQDGDHDDQFAPAAVQAFREHDRDRQVDGGRLRRVLRGKAQRGEVLEVLQDGARTRDDELGEDR